MFIDLNIHSTASDGTDTPEEIVEKIAQYSGVKIFALTDHDTIAGIEKLPSTFPDKTFFINGVEFSCKISNDTKCHILAYFFNAANEAFQQLLSKLLKNRVEYQSGRIHSVAKENLCFQMRNSSLDLTNFVL